MWLDEVIVAQKQGEIKGITSICSANSYVIRAAIQQAARIDTQVLVEATCNQVNQFGGYTGMTPANFTRHVSEIAREYNFHLGSIILGGDHLGPNAWHNEPAELAMQKSAEMIRDYVRAGFVKIHLDCSMSLADDPTRSLDIEISAQRTAQLVRVAEETHALTGGMAPRYIIGTEVPPPGGSKGHDGTVHVTKVEDVHQTLEVTHHAFRLLGLESAWKRVIAVVVQPGVEFGDTTIHPYQRQNAAALSAYIERIPHLVYEAHSTDYQSPQALREMVKDHFAILKVGPALTFAFRQAVFALEMIEQELMTRASFEKRSNLQQVVEEEMLAHPQHWSAYYHGSSEEQRFARRFSLSDRIRYYWPKPRIQNALKHLLANLSQVDVPLALISQFLPEQHRRIQMGELSMDPQRLIQDKISSVLRDYYYACGMDSE